MHAQQIFVEKIGYYFPSEQKSFQNKSSISKLSNNKFLCN